MKKNGKIMKTLLASLIAAFSLLFVIGCGNQSDSSSQKYSGKGTFTLRIAGENSQMRAYTIMPKQSDFKFSGGYTLKFTNYADESVQSFHFKEKEDRTVSLEAGVYDLKVTAYSEDNKPVAMGGMTNINITGGKTTIDTVALTAIMGGDGEGFFTWDIGLPDGLEEVSMKIIPLPGESEVLTRDLLDEEYSTPENCKLTLASGQYLVVFTLKKDDATQDVIWRETLHVYQNIPSNFTYAFTENHFIANIYTVKLTYNDGITEPVEKSYLHGENGYAPANLLRQDYSFDGWYTDDGKWLEKYTITTPLTGDLDLYAKWIGIPNLIVSPSPVTFSMQMQSDDEPQLPTVDVTISNRGTAEATEIGISLADKDKNTKFTLEGHDSISTIAARGEAGASKTFTIGLKGDVSDYEFNDGEAIHTFNDIIAVVYNGQTITTPVTFTVVNLQTGTLDANQILFNTRDLISFTNSYYDRGWWLQKVSGVWLRGKMIPGSEPIKITYGDGIDEIIGYEGGELKRGVTKQLGTAGEFTLQEIANNPGGSKTVRITLNLAIPHTSIVIKVKATDKENGKGANTLTDGNEITINGPYGEFKIEAQTKSVILTFEIDSTGTFTFISEDDTGFEGIPYPVFRQSNANIYFWTGNDLVGSGPGYWNWGAVDFYDFNPGAKGTTGTVTLHVSDPNESGLSFAEREEDAIGLNKSGIYWKQDLTGGPDERFDIDYTEVNPAEEKEFGLFIGAMWVGTVKITRTGYAGIDNGIVDTSTIDFEVVYKLNEEIAEYVSGYEWECNGTTITGTDNGSTSYTFTGQPFAPLSINTKLFIK
ncbi:MAG: InlB B-repeat-containing protein [Leptospirales bacterium]|nr:InlB B-repeat-containing protein [Leptospirales bacterium]